MKYLIFILVALALISGVSYGKVKFDDNNGFLVRWTTSADTSYYILNTTANDDTSQWFDWYPDMSAQLYNTSGKTDSIVFMARLQFAFAEVSAMANDSACGTRLYITDTTATQTTGYKAIKDVSTTCPIAKARWIITGSRVKNSYLTAAVGTIRMLRYAK